MFKKFRQNRDIGMKPSEIRTLISSFYVIR